MVQEAAQVHHRRQQPALVELLLQVEPEDWGPFEGQKISSLPLPHQDLEKPRAQLSSPVGDWASWHRTDISG